MPRDDIQPLREILHASSKRYLTVRPQGFQLQPGGSLHTSLDMRILSFGGARTLYVSRQPQCRSLDSVHPIEQPQRLCIECRTRLQCTPQCRIDLFAESIPFRLLLAYSSAKAFLLYTTKLQQRNLILEDILHRVTVVNRGSWGELRFRTLITDI